MIILGDIDWRTVSLDCGFILYYYFLPLMSGVLAFRRNSMLPAFVMYAALVGVSILVEGVLNVLILKSTGSLCPWLEGSRSTAILVLGWLPCVIAATVGLSIRRSIAGDFRLLKSVLRVASALIIIGSINYAMSMPSLRSERGLPPGQTGIHASIGIIAGVAGLIAVIVLPNKRKVSGKDASE